MDVSNVVSEGRGFLGEGEAPGSSRKDYDGQHRGCEWGVGGSGGKSPSSTPAQCSLLWDICWEGVVREQQ